MDLTNSKLSSFDFAGKRVLLRVDFNIPIKDEEVLNDERMVRALPTIKHLLEKAKSLRIITHRGRPLESGEVQPEFSIKPIAKRLSQLLDIPVPIADYLDDLEQDKKIIMLENIRFFQGEKENSGDLSKKLGEKEVVLVTGHRRENHGDGFERICKALKKIAEDDINRLIIYPVHLNPKVQEPVKKILSDVENIILIDPLAYQDFIWLMNRSKIIITDSGGVQEEAPSLGKPVLVMRDTTERPEAVEAGTVLLVGTNEELIVSKALNLLNNKCDFEKMSKLHNPYGDGQASKRIVDYIKKIK